MTRFTGWHMTAIIIGFFGVVIAVNLVMATLAVKTFGGTVVDDSYVAGQKFNHWLDTAKRQEASGWRADITRMASGQVRVVLYAPHGTTSQLQVTGSATHPLGRTPEQPLAFSRDGDAFVTARALPPGRWLARVTVWDARRDLARFEKDLRP
ncbi:FixH family protein [Sphingobium chungbukense]|nr:FixH family protein [Sphingobium chungbukense]